MRPQKRTILFIALLVVILVLLQYKLWFAKGGMTEVMRLNREVEAKAKVVDQLAKRNEVLAKEVEVIKDNKNVIEARARSELGMVKAGEEYYQIMEVPKKNIDENTVE